MNVVLVDFPFVIRIKNEKKKYNRYNNKLFS